MISVHFESNLSKIGGMELELFKFQKWTHKKTSCIIIVDKTLVKFLQLKYFYFQITNTKTVISHMLSQGDVYRISFLVRNVWIRRLLSDLECTDEQPLLSMKTIRLLLP